MLAEGRRPVLVYGAGGFGREVVSWLRADAAAVIAPIAFIDDSACKFETEGVAQLPVGPLSEMAERFKGFGVLFALSTGQLRQDAAARTLQAGLTIASFVHSSVIIGERVAIGEGSVIMPGNVLTCDITIGRLVVVNCSCNIGHDVTIGNCATLLGNNSLNGNVGVGEFATLGSRATILPGKQVGNRSTVGIGSVVVRRVPDDATVFGVPAKKI